MKNEVTYTIKMGKEPAFFLQLVEAQTGMEAVEIFGKMIDLYKKVYFSEHELAWIEGDTIVQKLDSSSLHRKG